MPVFTVHEPPPREGAAAAATDRFVFVRDRFSIWAFLFGPLWMIWRLLWLVLLLYLIAMAVLQAGLWALGASTAVKVTVGLLVSLLVGFEASSLRRWTLARRGWIGHGVVVADDGESAERRFFDAWATRRAASAAAPVSTPAVSAPASYRPAAEPVLGLFPEPQSRPR